MSMIDIYRLRQMIMVNWDMVNPGLGSRGNWTLDVSQATLGVLKIWVLPRSGKILSGAFPPRAGDPAISLIAAPADASEKPSAADGEPFGALDHHRHRSEGHTSELQSLMS